MTKRTSIFDSPGLLLTPAAMRAIAGAQLFRNASNPAGNSRSGN